MADLPKIDLSGYMDDVVHENSPGWGLEMYALAQMGAAPKRRLRLSPKNRPKRVAVMPDPIPAEIRAELDVTAEWWDRQYRALEHKTRDSITTQES